MVLGESSARYTNEGELCGNLVSVEVSKEQDCWVVDLKVDAGGMGYLSG
jgi:hypothetical protein